VEETFKLDTVGKWVKYEKPDREWSVGDFRPFLDERPSMHQQALALLQKGVILFQRKVYDGATRALAEYRLHLRHRSPDLVKLKIATGLLCCRYGFFSDIAQAFRSRDWPLSVRVAFASQIRWRVRTALTLGEVGYAADLANF
jgi:hypothetical protein